MGRLALGSAFGAFAGASVVFLCASTALGQVPAAEPPAPALPSPPPASPPAAPVPPAPLAPLDLPPNPQPGSRPAFLHTRHEMERIESGPTGHGRTLRVGPSEDAAPAVGASNASAVSPSFVARSTPWVDYTLTSFWMYDRVSNFLNLGIQVGGYFFDRLRVSARVVAPLAAVTDEHGRFGSGVSFSNSLSFAEQGARNMSMLYAVTAGFVVSDEKSFVFGPSVGLFRTDVEAYGSVVALVLPFEWTSSHSLRVGFEFDLGHAFGGSVRDICSNSAPFATSCGTTIVDRTAGSTIVAQFDMGWSLGKL